MSFETDLQKVRNEGRGLDWCGFLKLDADKEKAELVKLCRKACDRIAKEIV